jgi:hypothetical protein
MRYELIDYQREAARIIVDRLRLGRDLWASSKMPSSFALSVSQAQARRSLPQPSLRRCSMVLPTSTQRRTRMRRSCGLLTILP